MAQPSARCVRVAGEASDAGGFHAGGISMTRVHRLLLGSLITLLCGVMAACGQTSVSRSIGSSAATATATPSPSATATPDSTCQPDTYGLYAQQAGYDTNIDVAGLPAPPQTKHGIGSSGVANGVSRGGFTGMCTIGTADSINAFYTARLPALGWTFGTPPAALTTACTSGGLAFWSGNQWFTNQTLFSWDIEGPAGAGSTFWGYTSCAMVS